MRLFKHILILKTSTHSEYLHSSCGSLCYMKFSTGAAAKAAGK